VETPLDVILLEGWLVGFAPLALGPDADPSFAEANRRLAPYRAWTERLDALVLLHVADLDAIVAYRVDAERARRSATGRGLTDDEARDYIERFLPAYERWVPPLLAGSPIAGPVLCVEIGRDRSPVRPLTGREG
jgi:D-glycerate 3-kinase